MTLEGEIANRPVLAKWGQVAPKWRPFFGVVFRFGDEYNRWVVR